MKKLQSNHRLVCLQKKGWDIAITQQTFTCSKSTLEPLEKGVKYIQS